MEIDGGPQHQVVADLLAHDDRRSHALGAMDADPGARRRRLAKVYSTLSHAALVEHLDAEEQHVMPLVEVCITAKEWGAIGKAAQRGTPVKERRACSACSPMTATRTCLANMLGAVPRPLRGAVLTAGRRAYAKHAGRVYERPRPPDPP